MKKKTLKLLAVLLVICLAVTALAVFADSASCTLTKSQYYTKSGYAYGNYATGTLETKSDSAYSVVGMPFRLPSTSIGKNRMQMPTAKGRIRGKRSIGSAWAIDCQTR